MKVRWDPRRQQFPGLKGKLIVDTFRGQIRVRKWPRKRGPSKSQAVRDQNAWFKAANELAKRIEPTQQNLAIAMTKGTGLYPRDLILKQMSGGLYNVVFEDGSNPQYRRYFREKVMFQGAILEKTATQAIPAGTFVIQNWPLPVLDTAGFWNAGAPTLLTIPAGITEVVISAVWKSVGSIIGVTTVIVVQKNNVTIASDGAKIDGNQANSVTVGPVNVVAGDTFRVGIFSTLATTVRGAQDVRFTLLVVGAT